MTFETARLLIFVGFHVAELLLIVAIFFRQK